MRRGSLLSEDYILRMISQATAFLAQILGLKQVGQYEQAQQIIDQMLEDLLGLRVHLVRQLDESGVLQMLTNQEGELDIPRLALIAGLFKEDGDILLAKGYPEEARLAYMKALRFYLEVALSEEDDPSPDLAAKIIPLQRDLPQQDLPMETQLALLDYYERLLAMDMIYPDKLEISRDELDRVLGQLRQELGPYLE